MSILAYSQSKVIDEVTFKKNERDVERAYLHATPDIPQDTIRTILHTLRDEHYICTPYDLDGKQTIEVRGFRKEKDLLKLLNEKNWISGEAQSTPDASDNISWKEKLKKRSLQASGAAFIAADIGFATYGHKEKNIADTLAGLSYLGGSTEFLVCGKNDQSKTQIRHLSEMLLDSAREKGFTIPEDSAAVANLKRRHHNPISRVDHLLREYPAEIGNMMYAVAGALIAGSALKHKALAAPRPNMTAHQIAEMRKGGWGDALLGTTTITAGLISMFVKEKAHDPDAPKSHGFQAIADWIQESPLRTSAYLYMGSTLCHAYTTFIEHTEAKRVLANKMMSAAEHALAAEKLKSIPWRALFVGGTLVGELILSVSSKGHGDGIVSDQSVDQSAIAIAADLIVKQPKSMQNALIEHVGEFLGRPDVLAIKNQDATELLRKQVERMRDNPWALAENDIPASAQSLSTKNSVQGKEAAPWKTKVLPPTGPQLQSQPLA